jgi:hypothetical protein
MGMGASRRLKKERRKKGQGVAFHYPKLLRKVPGSSSYSALPLRTRMIMGP